jgi:XTP/dITP diphosphohydrolase
VHPTPEHPTPEQPEQPEQQRQPTRAGEGSRLLELVEVMDRLRNDCPWDREQTHRSLAPYLLEETYETLEAIESGDRAHLREELGDLLLQVVFHARVAAEAGSQGFTIDDVAGGIVDKLVHRHPHVFAGLEVAGADEVNANWERLKDVEKGRASVLEGIPVALPALALADKVLGRAARVGVAPREGDDLGDRLLALVVEARGSGRDAEQELRHAVRALTEDVRAAEPPVE